VDLFVVWLGIGIVVGILFEVGVEVVFEVAREEIVLVVKFEKMVRLDLFEGLSEVG